MERGKNNHRTASELRQVFIFLLLGFFITFFRRSVTTFYRSECVGYAGSYRFYDIGVLLLLYHFKEVSSSKFSIKLTNCQRQKYASQKRYVSFTQLEQNIVQSHVDDLLLVIPHRNSREKQNSSCYCCCCHCSTTKKRKSREFINIFQCDFLYAFSRVDSASKKKCSKKEVLSPKTFQPTTKKNLK